MTKHRFSLLLAFLVGGCAPASVAEAEARHDATWLESHESRASLEALGRLADHDPAIASRLATRSGDANVMHAAWQAHTRGAHWGADVLHAALASPSGLGGALSELPAGDPRLEPFVLDLEHGIATMAGAPAATGAALVASLGAKAQPSLARLLEAPATRDATCVGLATSSTSTESRMALTGVQRETRLLAPCRAVLLQHAVVDGRVLDWIARAGESELLADASSRLDCATLAPLWERVLASPRDDLGTLETSLGSAIARCANDFDPLLSRALSSVPRVRGCVLHALDSDAFPADRLTATCKQLPRLSHGRSLPDDVRTLSSSLLQKRCITRQKG